jgi:hypothetical protein
MKTQLQEKSLKSVKEVNKKDSGNKELIKKEEIKDSPFTVVTINGESFGVMGGYRVTKKTGTVEQIKKELEKITWNRIVQVMMILKELQTENEK